MLTYDQLLAAKNQFSGVKADVLHAQSLGLEYTNSLNVLLALAELGMTLCNRYERDALSHPRPDNDLGLDL